ncbi:flagellar hook-associated protein FlgL [Planomonospora parontospora subsp. parontospora]|uniref:Flagellar hook-associated protein FlgL n=2 Tax=Planomonospora parontospora TaxID=58119 RepID=A0AA37BP86_9ACTN|nr:flagellar hook-associated protein FlgL [Planomonospora parontospora]GGL01084.1 flagellar hook-associated protein FlgL [Planomonospora parontospora]GII13183.1 flagellar hook-associated protein FlgL [Planomonospora parontospora subsp. parontospora]
MTYMRVTERSISTRVLNNLQGNISRLDDIQQKLSSGKQLSRPSDSPTGTTSALSLRSDIRTQEQYIRNTDDGLGWLGTIDTALTNANSQVNRARELVLQGMSAGAGGSASARTALAVEIENIRDSLIGVANTTYLGRPVFGGAASGSVAYESDGTYKGQGGEVLRSIGDNTKIAVNSDGERVFGSGSNQLFTVLSDIARNLKGNPGALTSDLTRLDTSIESMQTEVADIGARYNRVTQMRDTADARILSLKTQLSDIEDIDLPMTITELTLQQTAYQAALAATAKVVQPSLVDFLK